MLFPESAKHFINGTDNFLLMTDWHNFNELDPELDAVFFPAWMMLIKPALAKIKVNVDEDNIGIYAFQLICSLILCTGKNIDKTTLSLRFKLRNRNPSLFSHYIAGCK